LFSFLFIATFPNHITLVTGLNPESHGIVQNSLYDPKYNQTIRLPGYTDLYDVKWWNESTPVWMTAKNQV
jgi:ectonucleotide pyrophosphatase/phosphodiesterase family protein 5